MGMNINNLMKQAQEMQKKMQDAQGQIAKMEVTGEAGGGLVKITINGQHKVVKVELNPAYTNEQPDVLEAVILAAFNVARDKVEAAAKEQLSKITAGLNLPEGFNGPGTDTSTGG